MNDTNVIVISGTVGDDVDYRVFPDTNKGVAEISLVSNKYRKNQEADNFDQYATWTTVKFQGRVADLVSRKLIKGSTITVTGELAEAVWDDKNNPGKKVRKLYIFGHSFNVSAGGNSAGNNS